MKKVAYLLSMCIAAALFTASCKKGDVGPQGEKGDTGAAGVKGATGADGADGVKGATGTANVIYSDWVYAKNFRDTTADNSALHLGDILVPKLTTTMLNSGTVLLYFTFGGGDYVLPYTGYAGGKLSTLSYWPRLGHIIVTRFTADNSNSVGLSTLLQYRYILIPGGVKTATLKQHNIDINNFDAVVKYYNIKN